MDLISAAAELRWLRSEFPAWGIFHDPYAERWFGIYGQRDPIVAETPQNLRSRILATATRSSASSGAGPTTRHGRTDASSGAMTAFS